MQTITLIQIAKTNCYCITFIEYIIFLLQFANNFVLITAT